MSDRTEILEMRLAVLETWSKAQWAGMVARTDAVDIQVKALTARVQALEKEAATKADDAVYRGLFG